MDNTVAEQTGEEQVAGDQSADWRAGFPEDVLAWEEVKNAESQGDFLNWVSNARSRMGRSISIPSPEATPEEKQQAMQKAMKHYPELMLIPDVEDSDGRSEMYTRLGTPEEATSYEVPEVEGITVEDDRMSFLKNAAKKAGLTKDQFSGLVAEVLGADAQMMAEQRNVFDSQVGELKTEWGQAYEQRTDKTTRALEQFGLSPELAKKAAGDPSLARALHGMVDALGSEVAQVATQTGDAGAALTPDEAQERFSDLQRQIYKMPPGPERDAKMNRMMKYAAMTGA